MEIQVISVKGSKKMKKMANKQFKMLCNDYNQVYKIIDTLKTLLDNGEYNKGDINTFPTAVQAIQTVFAHASLVEEDLEKTIDELVKRLRYIEKYKGKYMISPLLYIRLEHMSYLVVYLREVKVEVSKIVNEIDDIINRITKIEEFETI